MTRRSRWRQWLYSGDDRGLALLTVLWFVALMSALAVAIAGYGRDTAYVSRNAITAIETRIAMAEAVDIAAASFLSGSFPATGQLTWKSGNRTVTITATPESAKIDLNGAGEELVKGLAAVLVEENEASNVDGLRRSPGVSLADAILDWRDVDSERRLAGAEAADYPADATGGRGGPEDGPFRFVAELRSVQGIDRKLFERLAPYVTVSHGGDLPNGSQLPSLVQDAIDRASGIDQGLSENRFESGFDTDVQALNDDESVTLGPVFFEDPQGTYTLDIEVAFDDGRTFRQQTVIWIDPPFGGERHIVLENRSMVLPDAASTGRSSE